MSGIARIRKRENARRLFSKLEQHWFPKLELVRVNALSTLKHHKSPILVSSRARQEKVLPKVLYGSAESFGIESVSKLEEV